MLDQLLLERARSLPVDVRERHRVTDVVADGRRVVGVRREDAAGRPFEVRSPLVVGADGRASVVARTLGLLRPHRLRRMALVQHVGGLGDLDGFGEIYIDPPDYSILNPVAPGVRERGPGRAAALTRGHSRGRLETFFRARLKQLRHLWPRLAGMSRSAR